jgi:RNA polymerase subunit RPABC4/transcription elongation factor Spt4
VSASGGVAPAQGRQCPRCERIARPDESLCPECGLDLLAAAAPVIARPTPAPFLPAADPSPCPRCERLNGPGQVVCAECGLNLRTGLTPPPPPAPNVDLWGRPIAPPTYGSRPHAPEQYPPPGQYGAPAAYSPPPGQYGAPPAYYPPPQGLSGLVITGYVFAVLIPIVGFILGIIAASTGDRRSSGHGIWVILLSVVVFLVWLAIVSSAGSGY